MTTTLGGPMFQPSETAVRKSVFGQTGGHYNIFATKSPNSALAWLRENFADTSTICEMNLVFFSTSGVHGTYRTIEDVEADIREFGDEPPDLDDPDCDRPGRYVTFLLVQPRLVGMTYGNCACETLDDVRFLKSLRSASWKAARLVGAQGKPPPPAQFKRKRARRK